MANKLRSFVPSAYPRNTKDLEAQVLAWFAELLRAPQRRWAYGGHRVRTESARSAVLHGRRRFPGAMMIHSAAAHLNVGDSEAFWLGFLTALKRRGLAGMRLVISDQYSGLVAAMMWALQGSAHQRCRVHFARNLLALVPKTHTDMVAAVFRTIFASPNRQPSQQHGTRYATNSLAGSRRSAP